MQGAPTKAEQKRMLALLEWLQMNPKTWWNIPQDGPDRRTIELLEQNGAVETRQPMNQFRLKPAT